MSDFPFSNLLIAPINSYMNCLGLKETIHEPGFPNLMSNIIDKCYVKTYGWLALNLGNLYKFVQESVDAIRTGDIPALTTLVNKYISPTITEFQKLTNQPVIWLNEQIGDCYKDIKTPIPSINMAISNFSISFTSNSLYNTEWDNLSTQRKSQVFNVSKVVERNIFGTISSLFKKVTVILKLIQDIASLSLQKIKDAIVQLGVQFLALSNPLAGIVDDWLEVIISWFNVDDISAVKNRLITKILKLEVNTDDLPDELKLIYKMVRCLVVLFTTILTSIMNFSNWI